MKFSEWLKTYRRVAKLSQEKLADKITELGKSVDFSITGAQISNYEREYDKDQDGNPTRPKIVFVELAAKALNRPVSEAKTAAGYSVESGFKRPQNVAEFVETLEKLGIVDYKIPGVDLKKLPPEALAQLLEMIEVTINIQLKKVA